MKSFRLFYFFGIVTFALTIFFLVYLLFLLWFPFHPVQINRAYVITKQVKAGDAMLYAVDYCKLADIDSNVYRQVQSVDRKDFAIPFPAIATVSRIGCHVVIIPLMLPLYTPPGHYYLRVDSAFQVNPIRIVHVLFQTDVFQVLP